MKIKLVFIFLLIVSLSVCKGQDIDRVRKCIKTLCSKKMAGRGYVKKGDLKAAQYLKKEFQKIGLQPFKGTYFQNFNLNINTFPSKVNLQADGKSLVIGE